MSEYEKKLKKLEIIEKELTDENYHENQMAVRMLKDFLDDKDRRVELDAVRVLHKINPKEALNHIAVLLKKEKSSALRIEACRKLGEMVSKESIDLMLNLAQSKSEDIKRTAFSVLSGIMNKNIISGNYKSEVKQKLQEIAKKERWVIS
jgi:HEAT repeat protein